MGRGGCARRGAPDGLWIIIFLMARGWPGETRKFVVSVAILAIHPGKRWSAVPQTPALSGRSAVFLNKPGSDSRDHRERSIAVKNPRHSTLKRSIPSMPPRANRFV